MSDLIEKAGNEIFAAENGLDGDSIGTMLHENFRVEGETVEDTIAETKKVCDRAAQAAFRVFVEEQEAWAQENIPMLRAEFMIGLRAFKRHAIPTEKE